MNYNTYKGIKLTQRKDGRWQARFTANKARKYIYGNTQKECYEELKAFFESNTIKIDKSITFFEYWETWYKKYKEPFYKEGTLKNYRSVFKNQIKPNFKDKNIKQITALEMSLFIKSLPDCRMKEYTSQYIKECFKQAYKDRKIKNDIWEDIIKYHHKRKEGNALTIEQRQILIEKALNNNDYDIFIFYLYTGCRMNEALSITTKHFEKELLRIPGTKTEGSDRWIPIFEPIKQIYERRKDNCQETLFDIAEKTLKRRLIKFKELCQFDFKIKDLRTTFATMCAEQGIQPSIIAKWLGHTTTNTTNKYYIKVLNDFEKAQIKLLDTTFDTTKKV